MNQALTESRAARWLKDLNRFLPLKSQFVLSGNTRDLTAYEIEPGLVVAQSFVET